MTFNEVREEYGALEQYYERRENEGENSEASERGYNKGFKAGYKMTMEESSSE